MPSSKATELTAEEREKQVGDSQRTKPEETQNPKDPYPSRSSRFDGPNPIPRIGLEG